MSSLTNNEIEVNMNADLDLGVGYPKIPIPNWLQEELYSIKDFPLAYTSDQTLSTRNALTETDLMLKNAICNAIGLPEKYAENCFVTFSGSVAMDRAIKSLANKGNSILIESPIIDIATSMAYEAAFKRVDYFIDHPPEFNVDVNAIIKAIKPDTRVILVSSPNNPTGNILHKEALLKLIELSIDRDIVIIIDACFASLNPFNQPLHFIPELALPKSKWIMIWDTGKVFGLNEEKLGFLFCSPNLRNLIERSVNTIQFGVSRRKKLLFKRIYQSPNYFGYIKELNSLIQYNAQIVQNALSDFGFKVLSPDAGSVILIDISSKNNINSDLDFCLKLLKQRGIGVVGGSSFFHSNEMWKTKYVRMALARKSEIVEQACKAFLDI